MSSRHLDVKWNILLNFGGRDFGGAWRASRRFTALPLSLPVQVNWWFAVFP